MVFQDREVILVLLGPFNVLIVAGIIICDMRLDIMKILSSVHIGLCQARFCASAFPYSNFCNYK